MKEWLRQFANYFVLLIKKWVLWLFIALDVVGIFTTVLFPHLFIPQPFYWMLAVFGLLVAGFQVYYDCSVEAPPLAVKEALAALNNPNHTERGSAIETLTQIGDRAALEALAKATNHVNPDVRIDASFALARQNNDLRAVPGLIEALRDSDRLRRRDAAESLGDIGDNTAVPALCDTLRDGDTQVCIAAAEALGKLGDEGAVSGLSEALNSKYPLFRKAAASALGQIGGDITVSTLGSALLREQNRKVCQAIVEALKSIGTSEALNAVQQWQRVQTIRGKYAV